MEYSPYASQIILSALAESTKILLASKGWEGVEKALERIGRSVDASRAYIFENSYSPKGEILISQKYEWAAPGIEPQINNPLLQELPLEKLNYSLWLKQLCRGVPVCVNIRDLPASEQVQFLAQDILSLAIFPVFIEEKMWGLIGFDDCWKERDWLQGEIEALQTASNIFASVVLRNNQARGLEEKEKRYRSLFEESNDAILLHNLKGEIVEANQKACDLFDYTKEELMQQQGFSLVPSDMVRQLLEGVKRLQDKKSIKLETKILCKGGKTLEVEISSKPVNSDPPLIQSIIRDITEQRVLQTQLLEVAEMERRRFGQELHDGLCQDLKAIELAATVLQEQVKTSTPENSALCSLIAGESNKALKTAYSIAKGLTPLGLNEESLLKALEEFVQHFELKYGIKVELNYCQDVISLDKTRDYHLYRIIQEACRNSVTHGRARNIRISLNRKSSGFYLTIQDDGCGFNPEKTSSTGMGIYIMKSRAKAIDGSLQFFNPKTGGSLIKCWSSEPFPRKEGI